MVTFFIPLTISEIVHREDRIEITPSLSKPLFYFAEDIQTNMLLDKKDNLSKSYRYKGKWA